MQSKINKLLTVQSTFDLLLLLVNCLSDGKTQKKTKETPAEAKETTSCHQQVAFGLATTFSFHFSCTFCFSQNQMPKSTAHLLVFVFLFFVLFLYYL